MKKWLLTVLCKGRFEYEMSVLRQTKRLEAVNYSQGVKDSAPITKYLLGPPPHTFNIECPK